MSAKAVCPDCGDLGGYTGVGTAMRMREGHYRNWGAGHYAAIVNCHEAFDGPMLTSERHQMCGSCGGNRAKPTNRKAGA